MLAAVLVTASITTQGTPPPTGMVDGTPPAALTARVTVRAIAVTIRAGVDGTGVTTLRRGATSSPSATSTTPTLIPLPPTSTPIARLAGEDVVGRLAGEYGEDGVGSAISEVIAPDAAVAH